MPKKQSAKKPPDSSSSGSAGGGPNFFPQATSAKPLKSKNPFVSMLYYVHNNITALNQSKIFAGIIIIILNISSKFVSVKLSKSMESYLKYTFSRDILVFAMTWMGTRDIYTAFLMTVVFSVCVNYFFNEESSLCCLPESFTDYHKSKLETEEISEEEVDNAKKLLAKFEKQQEDSSKGTDHKGTDHKETDHKGTQEPAKQVSFDTVNKY
jgi:hypothetical protein